MALPSEVRADPVAFGWNPSAVLPGADGPFTADGITVRDHSVIRLSAAGTFSESGLMHLSGFALGGQPVSLPGLDATYALYIAYTAGGLAPTPTASGAFTSLSYTLFAAAGTPVFSAGPGGATVAGLGDPVAVAGGSLA